MRLVHFLCWAGALSGCVAGSTETSRPTASTCPAAETTEEHRAVVATVQSLFDALRERDVSAATALLLPGARFVAVDAEGIHPSTRESFLERLPTMEGNVEERMWNPEVRMDGNVATLWAPYEFLEDSKVVHCGFDSLQLIRVDGRWRVVSIAFTSRPPPCPDSPL